MATADSVDLYGFNEHHTHHSFFGLFFHIEIKHLHGEIASSILLHYYIMFLGVESETFSEWLDWVLGLGSGWRRWMDGWVGLCIQLPHYTLHGIQADPGRCSFVESYSVREHLLYTSLFLMRVGDVSSWR